MIRLSPSLLLAPLLLLAACRREDPDPVIARAEHAAAIPCALAGGALRSDCTVERVGAQALVLHHPDGGFRRLAVLSDGRGVAAADGAEPAAVRVIDPATIEVTIGGDRYRLPATVGGPAPAAR